MKLALYCVVLLVLALSCTATPQKRFKPIEFKEDTVGCDLCQLVATDLFNWMSQNTTEAEVQKFLVEQCRKLPFPASYECEWMAGQIVKLIPILVYNIPRQDILPIDVCGLINKCEIHCCASKLPEQVRLSGTSDNTLMVVSWITADKLPTLVQYGTSASFLPFSITGDIHTYNSGNWKGWIHNATITGLKEDTKYFYRVGSNEGGFSPVYHFTTFRNSNFSQTVTTWGVIGDMGTNNESDATIARLENLVASGSLVGILHNGDLAYADGVQRRWDLYGRKIEKITPYVQYQTIPGNHEMAIVTYLGLEGYKNRWFMPYDWPLERPGHQEAYWYTFTRGPLRVIGLNSESHLDIAEISPDQLTWLKATLELAQATRDTHPWVVVMLHRPLYCSSTSKSNCETFAKWLRDWLEPFFYEYKVDIVLTAHMHSIERTLPVYNEVPYPGYHKAAAPVYIINGAAGNREGISGFRQQPAVWDAFRMPTNGYGLMTVTQGSLTWKWYSSADNVLRDTMILTK